MRKIYGFLTPTFFTLVIILVMAIGALMANLAVNVSINAAVGSVTTSAPIIAVISPNGGESWMAGTTQIIEWKSNIITIPEQPITFDIYLSAYCAPGKVCTALAPLTIVKTVSGLTYNWPVIGVPAGNYRIKVCQSGTTMCDSSDSYFKITPGPSYHPADTNKDYKISQSEVDAYTKLYKAKKVTFTQLTRVIQFFNSAGYRIQAGTEDGFAPILYHPADLNQDYKISLSEMGAYANLYQAGKVTLTQLMRVIQFFNSAGYKMQEGTEDGFAPILYHPADLNQDYKIDKSELDAYTALYQAKKVTFTQLTRVIQFYNSAGYKIQAGTEDGFAPIIPSITVTSPNGGEIWKLGEAHDITWTSAGINQVKLWLTYTKNGVDHSVPVSGDIFASLGKYTWTVNNYGVDLTGTSCKIGAVSTASTGSDFDVSDNYFSIVAP